MSGTDLINWSGWIFGLVGFVATIVAELRVHREKRRGDRMADALAARADRGRLPRQSDRSDQVRSYLVHAAAGGQPVSVAVARARRLDADETSVLAMAQRLRGAGLLDYDDPLKPESELRLRP